MIRKEHYLLLTILFSVSVLMISCGDDDTLDYEIPTIYSFDNVSYSGQTQRLAMLTEMTTYMKTANTTGTVLDATKLKAMYANADGAGFSGTYEASKQLKSKTFEAEQSVFEAMIDEIAAASTSTTAGANGTAGVATSADGAKSYLLDENGVEYTQLIEKGLMGACLYYQATTVYFGAGKMDVDNETVVEGEGTAMEHHWDEAFGYFGVPIDFPINTDGIVFWGNYSNGRDALLGTNAAIMDNLIKGRAAISNNDLEARDEAITAARLGWEKASAGTAIHYINSGLSNFSDDALRCHALSEAIAFAYALKFNEGKTITNAQVDEVLTLIGGSSDLTSMNLYNVTEADLNSAKDKLSTYFGFDAVKEEL